MRLLAIETATEACSVALCLGTDLLERSELAPRAHAELLLPWIGELLAEGGVRLADLDALAFSRGPGSFTSLRIGIGVAQGLAWGAGIGVVPVSTLQATAQAVAGENLRAAIVALDARMDEVYCGAFRLDQHGLMQPAGGERVCAPQEVTQMESRGWSGVGNGFGRYSVLEAFAGRLESVHAEAWPQAAAMIPLALDWLARNDPLPAHRAQPVYIRDEVAQKPVRD